MRIIPGVSEERKWKLEPVAAVREIGCIWGNTDGRNKHQWANSKGQVPFPFV